MHFVTTQKMWITGNTHFHCYQNHIKNSDYPISQKAMGGARFSCFNFSVQMSRIYLRISNVFLETQLQLHTSASFVVVMYTECRWRGEIYSSVEMLHM